MKKFDLIATVQMLANIGVIAGILFLAIQIHGNTVATQAQNIEAASSLDQEFLLLLSTDPVLAKIWTGYLTAPELLSEDERLQGRYMFAALLRRLENAYLQHQLGALSDDGWQARQELFVSMARSAGFAEFSKSSNASSSGAEILGYMEHLRQTQ